MQHDTIGDDHIDRSQWLPDGEPLITPERAAKGDVLTGNPCTACDMTGRDANRGVCRECSGKGRVGIRNAAGADLSEIRFAQIQVRSILNFLWNAEIISDDEHIDGHTFEAWRNQHRVAMGLQKAISNDSDEPLALKLRAYGYVLLLKKLSVYDVKAVNKAIDVSSTFATEQEAIREKKPYQDAFRNLAKAIIPIREQITYLESASEEDRELLANGQLKILLELISKQQYDKNTASTTTS